jgi:hypothetical protein
MADRVEAYLTLPGDIRHFLSKVPAAWDETKFLAGEPGKFCVIARKSGNSWYIGGINGTNETMDLSIDISVLTDNKTDLFLITDSDKPDKFDTGKLSIDKGEKLNLSLKAAGGFAATLTN